MGLRHSRNDTQPKARYGLLDRVRDRQLGLSKGHPYTVTEHEVGLRDGLIMKATHYAPTGPPRGTVVALSPYGRTTFGTKVGLAGYAAQGYHLVVGSVRGTFGSGGDFDPMFHDGDDYRDLIGWIRSQTWYTGSFATAGASYLGWTQWALLEDPQPDHKAAIITVGPHDFADVHWGTGSLSSLVPLWAAAIEEQEGPWWRSMRNLLTGGERIYRLLKETPAAEAVYQAAPHQRGWLEERFARPDLTDPFWEPGKLEAVLAKVDIPVLLTAGWQDIFLHQSLEQFRQLSERGVNVALTAGPWEHRGASVGRQQTQESLEWLQAHLEGTGPSRPHRVHLHVTGADEWRNLESWPPRTEPRRLHIGADSLSADPQSGELAFSFDPADPPTFSGGPLLTGGGYTDDTKDADHDGVVSVASAPLDEDLEVHGTPLVVLDHAADYPDSDIFVRLSDVDERGRSRNVAQGMIRTHSNGEVRLELHPIAHRFLRGHRIRIAIAGGGYPFFPPSPGNGENPMLATSKVANWHTVALEGSYIELPIAASHG